MGVAQYSGPRGIHPKSVKEKLASSAERWREAAIQALSTECISMVSCSWLLEESSDV